MFALSRFLGRTTKDNGCDGLGGNCNGEECRAGHGWGGIDGAMCGGS